MKAIITVELDDNNRTFFADLVNGNYAWARAATLRLTNINSFDVDATWLLRAEVELKE